MYWYSIEAETGEKTHGVSSIHPFEVVASYNAIAKEAAEKENNNTSRPALLDEVSPVYIILINWKIIDREEYVMFAKNYDLLVRPENQGTKDIKEVLRKINLDSDIENLQYQIDLISPVKEGWLYAYDQVVREIKDTHPVSYFEAFVKNTDGIFLKIIEYKTEKGDDVEWYENIQLQLKNFN